MITLEKAVKIAKEYLEARDLFVRNTCNDLGDSWIFGYGRKESPQEVSTDGALVKVDKEIGHVAWTYLGVPGEENFDKIMKAPKIDISEYLSKENLELCKVPLQITFPEGTTVIEISR